MLIQIWLNKISYFENNALKFEESFSFGSEIIISDISKILDILVSINQCKKRLTESIEESKNEEI